MELWFPCCLRLDDHFDTKRWLTTRRVAGRLAQDGQCEIEERTGGISLQANLTRLCDLGNPSWGLRGFIERGDFGHFLTQRYSRRPDEIVSEVMAAIDAGWLVVIREAGPKGADRVEQTRAEARRIASEVDSLTKGRLRSSGRRYTLCPPKQVDSSTLGLTRRMLVPREATMILDRMIEEYAASRELVQLLCEAKSFFPRDGRVEPELVLLRHLVQHHAPESTNAAVTPSQIQRSAASWVELVVVWEDSGQPVAGVPLTVEWSGNQQAFKTDSSGQIRVNDVDGSCSVTSKWDGATIDKGLCVASVGASPPTASGKGADSNAAGPLRIVAIEAHKVKTGETLEGIAADAGVDWKKLAKFNWGTDVPKKINEHLRDELGCTKQTADGRNYVFDDTDTPGVVYIPSDWTQSFQAGRTHFLRVRRPKGLLLHLENELGLPLPEVAYRVVFDDDTERTGVLGRNGMALVPAPSTGKFSVTYPDEVDIMAKSLAACVRKGFDDRRTDQLFRLFAHDRPVVARALAAYDQYFNDYTGKGFSEDVYQEISEPEALAVCEALMALHGIATRSGVRVSDATEVEAGGDDGLPD